MEIHQTLPENFCTDLQVATCYLEIDGKLLLLQVASHKSEAGKWGLPGGKLEPGESPQDAIVRELFEETGIQVDPSQLHYIDALYIKKPDYQFVYHSFRLQNIPSDSLPEVRLSKEHENYVWAHKMDLAIMPLMPGALEIYKRHQFIPSTQKRSSAVVSVYLIAEQSGQVLLGLRQNTGYNDGLWSLVAGHVEEGEPATTAMIREAKEEVGISLSPENLRVVHVMHRKSNRLCIDIFFACSQWEGTVTNCEPKKCGGVQFFPLDALPSKIVGYNKDVLAAMKAQEFYSEQGWT